MTPVSVTLRLAIWLGSAGAGDGIRATNSHLHLVRCLVRGGDTPTVFCFYPPGDGVVTDRGDRTWIADSTLVGGTSACGPGGAALVNTSASPARLARATPTAPAGLLRFWRSPDSWYPWAASINQSKSNMTPYF